MPLTRWLKGLRHRWLEPSWIFSTQGMIWRLLPAPGKRFVGEERDISQKSVSLFCIEQETGAIQWRNLRLHEPWWIGIEAVHKDLVLLHEYAMPDLPDHKKIHALELSSGKVLWKNEELRYLFAYQDSIYAVEIGHEDNRYYEVDLMTGEKSREVDASSIATMREIAYSQNTASVEFPAPFQGGGDDDLSRMIAHLTKGESRIESIEYLRKGEFLALCYHTVISPDPAQRIMDQHFMISDGRRMVYHELLNDRVQNVVPDAFFGIGDFVYSIKGKRVLQAFNFSKGVSTDGQDKN